MIAYIVIERDGDEPLKILAVCSTKARAKTYTYIDFSDIYIEEWAIDEQA